MSGVRRAQNSYTTYSYDHGGYNGHRRGPTFCGAIQGALFGLLLLAGSVFVLWKNEGVAVSSYTALAEARVGLAEGSVMHVTGPLESQENLVDALFGIETDGLQLERRAEVWLWREHKHEKKRQVSDGRGGSVTERETTYSYDLGWERNDRPSERFQHGTRRGSRIADLCLIP